MAQGFANSGQSTGDHRAFPCHMGLAGNMKEGARCPQHSPISPSCFTSPKGSFTYPSSDHTPQTLHPHSPSSSPAAAPAPQTLPQPHTPPSLTLSAATVPLCSLTHTQKLQSPQPHTPHSCTSPHLPLLKLYFQAPASHPHSCNPGPQLHTCPLPPASCPLLPPPRNLLWYLVVIPP